MTHIEIPFITSGYISQNYFCGREAESKKLCNELSKGNNVAIISTRRMGKKSLIQHYFANKEISKSYYTFFVDVYSTLSLKYFVYEFSKAIFYTLKSHGKKELEKFLNCLKSMENGITYDSEGTPSFNVKLGCFVSEEQALNEIFDYLGQSKRPCIVAINEFQQFSTYDEKNAQAMLQARIEQCPNAKFIFACSQRHTMGEMFTGESSPFHKKVSLMHLNAIPLNEYTQFVQQHFAEHDKAIDEDVVDSIYTMFEGITWYMQMTLNALFRQTYSGETCNADMIAPAIKSIIDTYDYYYSEIIFRIPERHTEFLIAVAQEGKASEIITYDFIKRHQIVSLNAVQSALKSMLFNDFILREPEDTYCIYDRFFALWLTQRY